MYVWGVHYVMLCWKGQSESPAFPKIDCLPSCFLEAQGNWQRSEIYICFYRLLFFCSPGPKGFLAAFFAAWPWIGQGLVFVPWKPLVTTSIYNLRSFDILFKPLKKWKVLTSWWLWQFKRMHWLYLFFIFISLLVNPFSLFLLFPHFHLTPFFCVRNLTLS